MKKYEITFILKGSLNLEENDKIFEEIKEKIYTLGSQISSEKKWGLRKLAYQIKKQDQGYYFTINFSSDEIAIKELENFLKLENAVIRFLITLSYKKVGTIDFKSEKERREKPKLKTEKEATADKQEQEKKLEQALEKILEE